MLAFDVTHDDIQRFGGWYSRIQAVIVQRFGKDAGLFIDLLAATSPRTHVKSNWRLAVRIYNQWLHGSVQRNEVMASHWPNVQRALNREPLHGEKVCRFARNLRGEDQYVTIDTWILKAYGMNASELNRQVYQETEARIQAEAEAFGVSSSAYQAVVWQLARQAYGRKTTSFFAAIEEEKQMNLWEN